MTYSHLRLVDSFYTPDGRGERVRVTRDEKTGAVHACVQKVRLGNIDVYSPKRAADWRISVNVEIPGEWVKRAMRLYHELTMRVYIWVFSAATDRYSDIDTEKRPVELLT